MQKNNPKKILRIFSSLILDLLFPISCFGCNENGKWLCDKCFSKIKLENEQVCPICENVETPDGKTCFSCRKKTSLNGLLVCTSYKEKLVSKIIHAFKYKFVSDLHEILGKIIIKRITLSSVSLPDFIIPVPLHAKRLRWRGFNQAELLAEYFSKNITPGFKIPVLTKTLQRKRFTTSQMKIKDFQERKINISDAFSITNSSCLKEKRILLIDDVATTGSTIFECAKTLKKAGAKEIFGVVIARQSL